MAVEKCNSIFTANVFHKRLFPSVNRFNYKVFYLFFNINKLHKNKLKLLSINKFNIFSFFNCDHGKKDGSDTTLWIRDLLLQNNLNQKVKQIFLLTHPRVLGYVFNPVSFWFCCNENNKLISVLAEVNNTFGETHSYLIFNKDFSEITSSQLFNANKHFHVSPFYKVSGNYEFRFVFTDEKIIIWINYFYDNKKQLITKVLCKRNELSDFNLIKYFVKIPLLTFKIVFLIHWQALKLLFKKNKYNSKPQQKLNKLTIND